MAAQGSSIRTKIPARDSDLLCVHRLPGKDAHRSASQGSLLRFPSSQVLQTCHSSDSNWIHWCPVILVCQHGPGRNWQAALLWHTFLMLPLKPCPDCAAGASCAGHLQHNSGHCQALPCPSATHHSKVLRLYLRTFCDYKGALDEMHCSAEVLGNWSQWELRL